MTILFLPEIPSPASQKRGFYRVLKIFTPELTILLDKKSLISYNKAK